MPSPSPLPLTPHHSRHSSSFDMHVTTSSPTSPVMPLSPAAPDSHPLKSPSIQGASTPHRGSYNHQDSLDTSILSSGGGGGLGNLADELADALSDGDEDEYYDDGDDDDDDERASALDDQHVPVSDAGTTTRDSGVDVTSPTAASRKSTLLSGRLNVLSSPVKSRGRRATAYGDYDGSEYGSDSDLESPGMPPSLVAKIDAVESLARRGTENVGSRADGAVQRVTDGLRDLASQSGVEGSASRLITAHSALTTHLTHQTRLLYNLTFPLLSPLVTPPTPETIDDLLPLLVTLTDAMPRPSTSAYTSLSALHTLTADLVHTLNYLTDSLHMSRQTTTTATRRLKSARELVAEMKREDELRAEGERWLALGNWGERLRKREAADVCGEVVGGFEDVCNVWRDRLVKQAEGKLEA